jgi:hypothetical protein
VEPHPPVPANVIGSIDDRWMATSAMAIPINMLCCFSTHYLCFPYNHDLL